MRRPLLVVLLVIAMLPAAAQRPWSEYDARQRERIAGARNTPEVVRRAVDSLEVMSPAERAKLWDVVTSPTGDRQLASLYLYLYETLRPTNGTAAEGDIAMLRSYPAYFLERWSDELHRYDVYNYAYALAHHNVTEGTHGDTNGVMRKVARRRYARRYGAVVAALSGGVDIAESSLCLSSTLFADATEPEITERMPRAITAAEYSAVRGSVEPISAARVLGDDDLLSHIAAECIAWDGCYNVAIDHNLGRRVTIVRSVSTTSTSITMIDAEGNHHTLPERVYLLPGGALYAISLDRESRVEYVVAGRFVDGVLNVSSTAVVGDGVLRGAKCTDAGLYLHIEDRGSRYYVITI